MCSDREVHQEEIAIPVPPIIDEATWQAAQVQLEENSCYARRNNQKYQYLLRGLIRCPRCGGNYSGYAQHGSRGYRCARANWTVSSTGQRCAPGSIPAQPVEDAVWEAVKGAIQQPQVLVAEYTRRLESTGSANPLELEGKQIVLALKRLKSQEDRVSDAYINEAMNLARYKMEMNTRTRAHRARHPTPIPAGRCQPAGSGPARRILCPNEGRTGEFDLCRASAIPAAGGRGHQRGRW